MFLAVDAGNTKITFGFFDDNNVLKEIRNISSNKNAQYSDLKQTIKNVCNGYSISRCMIASVVDELTENIQKSITEIFNINPQTVSSTNCGINIKTPQPEKCGADRIANVYAAIKLYDKRPVIIVDSGSATTFDIIDKNNDFIGGLIMPGMELQLKALGEKTSKLPALDIHNIQDNVSVISNTTEESIYAGVVIAHAQAIQGLINLCEQKLNEKAYLVGTGGNINLVSKYMDKINLDVVNQKLTLEGIKLIYDLNN